MFEHNGKQYTTRGPLIRHLYDSGELDMSPESKKKWAKKLNTSSSNIHVTLVKYAKNKQPSYKKISQKEERKYRIYFAPNPWGLPVNTIIPLSEYEKGKSNSIIEEIIE